MEYLQKNIEFGSPEWFETVQEIELPETAETPVYKVEPTLRHNLDEVLQACVCSTCWGPLDFKYNRGNWYALCRSCKENTVGYVSKYFAERRREASEAELVEARRNLAEVLGMKQEHKSVDENLKALGF